MVDLRKLLLLLALTDAPDTVVETVVDTAVEIVVGTAVETVVEASEPAIGSRTLLIGALGVVEVHSTTSVLPWMKSKDLSANGPEVGRRSWLPTPSIVPIWKQNKIL